MATDVSVDAVMAGLRARVQDRLREDLVKRGASGALADPARFADVARLLGAAVAAADADALLLPELLGDPDRWRLDTAMRYQSHRGGRTAALLVGLKRHLLLPLVRWLFEYSRDNFERQRRVNAVLCACVQELAIETVQLREEVRRLSAAPAAGDPSTR